MRMVMGVALHDDHLMVATGRAATIAGPSPRPPRLMSFSAEIWWPTASAPRLARHTDPTDQVYRHYLDHVTDPHHVRVGAQPARFAHELIAATLRQVIAAVEGASSGHVGTLVVAHPDHWTPEEIGALRRVIGVNGLARSRAVTVVADSAALARCIRWSARMEMTDSLADHAAFAGAWGAALLAATAVRRIPVPDATTTRPARSAPHRTSVITRPHEVTGTASRTGLHSHRAHHSA